MFPSKDSSITKEVGREVFLFIAVVGLLSAKHLSLDFSTTFIGWLIYSYRISSRISRILLFLQIKEAVLNRMRISSGSI